MPRVLSLWQRYLDLSVNAKLMLYVVCFTIWLISVGAAGLWGMGVLSTGINRDGLALRRVLLVSGLKNDLLYLRHDLDRYFLENGDAASRAIHDAEQRLKTIAGGIEALERHEPDVEQRRLLGVFAQEFALYREAVVRLIELQKRALEKGDIPLRTTAASYAREEVMPLFFGASDAVTDLVEFDRQQALQTVDANGLQYARFSRVLPALIVAAVTLGLFFRDCHCPFHYQASLAHSRCGRISCHRKPERGCSRWCARRSRPVGCGNQCHGWAVPGRCDVDMQR